MNERTKRKRACHVRALYCCSEHWETQHIFRYKKITAGKIINHCVINYRLKVSLGEVLKKSMMNRNSLLAASTRCFSTERSSTS